MRCDRCGGLQIKKLEPTGEFNFAECLHCGWKDHIHRFEIDPSRPFSNRYGFKTNGRQMGKTFRAEIANEFFLQQRARECVATGKPERIMIITKAGNCWCELSPVGEPKKAEMIYVVDDFVGEEV
jgi:hypothetical protein